MAGEMSALSGRYVIKGLILIAVFLFGLGTGWYFFGGTKVASRALRESGYEYIKPILFCNLDSSLAQTEDTTLSKKLNNYIKSGSKDIGVYYINPTAGTWAGANEHESFSPASMLKIPIMTAILRSAETHPGLLSQKIYFDGRNNLNALEDIQPEHLLTAKQNYSINDLLHSMIADSDNNATALLTGALTTKEFADIYTDVGLSVPTASGPIDFMSAKTFTLFLRLLYNGTYLSREHSEMALKLMSESTFKQGLRAGVPANITVAEKFGERRVDASPTGNTIELHDCGIVYAPNDGYLLCVMTRGKDFNTLAKEIADVSKLVFDHQ